MVKPRKRKWLDRQLRSGWLQACARRHPTVITTATQGKSRRGQFEKIARRCSLIVTLDELD
jgi:hypothetical protein